MALRVLELFCGLGGCAAALGEQSCVVRAVDINRRVIGIYSANFPHATWTREIESLPEREFRQVQADLWWLSPPCQPYTTKGARRDLDDPRARSLVAVLRHVAAIRPAFVALENVPGFVNSQAHALVRETLATAGYGLREALLCPTQFGWPHRRERFYLVAGREIPTSAPAIPSPPPVDSMRQLADFVDPANDNNPALFVPEERLQTLRGVMHIINPNDTQAIARCFTSAYGRSWHEGSFWSPGKSPVRCFSPREIASLLGFPDTYILPRDCPPQRLWPLLGNSLAVPVVRYVLEATDIITKPPAQNRDEACSP